LKRREGERGEGELPALPAEEEEEVAVVVAVDRIDEEVLYECHCC
jgi:hypothetical protein